MDRIINDLHDIALQLMPIAGVICLILLAVALYRLATFLKALPAALDKVNDISESANQAIKKLDGPLDTANRVADTVDIVNNSAVKTATNFASFAIKNTESLIHAFKGKKHASSRDTSVEVEGEEDFDVFQ